MGECVNYCFDRANSRAHTQRFFRRVYQALDQGGVFVFDIVEPGQLRDGTSRRIYREGTDWAVFSETTEDRRRNILTRHITAFRRRGNLYRRSEETHRLRLYRSSELAGVLRRTGFRVRILRGYGRFRLARGHAVIVARKS